MLNTDLIIMAMGYPEYWAPSRAFSCKWASSEAFFLTGRHHSNHIKNTYHLEWRNASKTKWTSQVGTELSKRCITKHMVIQTKAMILLRNKSRKRRRHNSYIAHAGQNKTESHRNRITYQTYQTDHEPSWSWPLSGVFSCKRASSGPFSTHGLSLRSFSVDWFPLRPFLSQVFHTTLLRSSRHVELGQRRIYRMLFRNLLNFTCEESNYRGTNMAWSQLGRNSTS